MRRPGLGARQVGGRGTVPVGVCEAGRGRHSRHMSGSLLSSLLSPELLGVDQSGSAARLALAAVRSSHRQCVGRLWKRHQHLPPDVVEALLGDDLVAAVFRQSPTVATSAPVAGHVRRDALLGRFIAVFAELNSSARGDASKELSEATTSAEVPVELFVELFCVAPWVLRLPAVAESPRRAELLRAAAGAVREGSYRWGGEHDPVVLCALSSDDEALGVIASDERLVDVLVAHPSCVTVPVLDALRDPDAALGRVMAAAVPPAGALNADAVAVLLRGDWRLRTRAVMFVPYERRDLVGAYGGDLDSLMGVVAAEALDGDPAAQQAFWALEGDWSGTFGELLTAAVQLAAVGRPDQAQRVEGTETVAAADGVGM